MKNGNYMIRAAIYADVNANIIDGSSIWLKNISLLLSAVDNIQVDVYLKALPERDVITRELTKRENVKVRYPEKSDVGKGGVLSLFKALDIIEVNHLERPYDLIVLRGRELCLRATEKKTFFGVLWPYLTDIPQTLEDFTHKSKVDFEKIISSSRYLLCQTEAMRTFITSNIEEHQNKLVLLPPLVPDDAFLVGKKTIGPDNYRIIYSGKFAKLWAIEEFIESTEGLNKISVDIVGDKFHKYIDDRNYQGRLTGKLQFSDNVNWHGGLSQSEVFQIQQSCHYGFAWRLPLLDTSLELSTKLLEYGASGLAVITNPTHEHISLLGQDYPFFAKDLDELKSLIKRISNGQITNEVRVRASKTCFNLAEKYSFKNNLSSIQKLISNVKRVQCQESQSKKRVVLAGHDLKFSSELIEYFKARNDIELEIDHWESLRKHDVEKSKKLAEWADVVFCEWCAGNAVWYSNNIDSTNTQLFIRFHRIEILMEFPPNLNFNAVDKILFVGQHFLEQAKLKFGWDSEKLEYLPNFVDSDLYHRNKFYGSKYNLGLIGYVPKLKRLDRALDILESLRKVDTRYMLFIKGHHPWKYPWIWSRETEKNFYEACFKRIKSSPLLKDAVVFEPFANDIPHWLRKIGVILSVSDLESFHMALAEGNASGSFGIAWEREGVKELFPKVPTVESADRAAELIVNSNQDEIEIQRSFVSGNYDRHVVSLLLDSILEYVESDV